MQYRRINGRIDINNALEEKLIIYDEDESKGARNGDGYNTKFWFNDYTWMYKDVDNDYETYEDYAELICFEISKLLDVNCAEYDLAQFNNRKGVITKSVVGKDDIIISGTELLNTVYYEYFVPKLKLTQLFKNLKEEYKIDNKFDLYKLSSIDRKKFNAKLISIYNFTCYDASDYIFDYTEEIVSTIFEYCTEINEVYDEEFLNCKNGIIKSNNLYDIWNAVEIYCDLNGYKLDLEKFMKNLTDMLIFDIITNQGDRHSDNWSIIINKDTKNVELAGLYDNSGALALNREKALKNIANFFDKLRIEKRPGKIAGIKMNLKETIAHSFSGLKVDSNDVMNRNKNEIILQKYIAQSSEEFVTRLSQLISFITEDNINKIFYNIESKTCTIIPEIVKKTSMAVLMNNVNEINLILGNEKKVRR